MKKVVEKVLGNEFYRGGLILTVSTFLVNVFNYLFNFLIGRSLGPTGYGEISTLFSYITLLSIPTAILTTIIIQKIGSAEGDKLTYARSLEVFINKKLRKYLPFLLITLLLVPFLPRITNLSPLTSYVLIPFILLSVLSSIYNSLLQGLKMFFLISLVSLSITAIKLLGAVFPFIGIGGVEVVILFLIFASIGGYIGNILAIRTQVKESTTDINNTVEKRILHVITNPQFIITALSMTAITAINNIDIIYVKKFFSAQEAGLYGSWSLFSKAIFYALGPMLSVSYIFFAHTKDEEHQNRSFLLSLGALVLLGIGSFIFYTFFADFIISILFGSKFNAIIPFLGKASIYGSLYALIVFINNYFLAKKSAFSLILPLTLPFYIAGLFLVDKELIHIFTLNITYGSIVVLGYFIAFLLSKK